MDTKLKQYVIVPYKPQMSKGKIAAQVAHAAFMALEKQKEPTESKLGDLYTKKYIEVWKHSGMCVIVLGCKDATQLMGIAKYLDQWNVVNHLYIDEGMTEVGMGTPTCLATGVLPEEYHWMFSTLKLFKEVKKWNGIRKLLLQ